MKAAVTSYVVCVVSNFDFSKQYFSAKYAITWPPTVCNLSTALTSFSTFSGPFDSLVLTLCGLFFTHLISDYLDHESSVNAAASEVGRIF